MRSRWSFFGVLSVLLLGLQACVGVSEMTSAPESPEPLKSHTVSDAPPSADSVN